MDFHGITIKINICKVSRIFHVIFTRKKMEAYITDARTSSNVNAQVWLRERKRERERVR